MTKIVHGEHELMPQCTEEESAGQEPLLLIEDVGRNGHDRVAYNLGAIAGDVATIVEPGSDDAFVKLLVGGRVLVLLF